MTDFVNQTDEFTEGGSSLEGLKFETIGEAHTGIVTKVDKRGDIGLDGILKTWPDGQAKSVFIFTLLQDDGESRSLWVRGNMVKAIREAVAAAGVSTVVGSTLTVQHHAFGDKRPGFNQAKLFRANIVPPAAGAKKPGAEYGDVATADKAPWE